MIKIIRWGVLGLMTIIPFAALAHGADHVQGEQFTKDVQAGRIECTAITDAQFENMGDYFMEQMMGNSHEQMDAMMTAMMGEQGLDQMHAAMGKRMSGCDASAQMPGAMMSGMMNMLGSGGMMGGTKLINGGKIMNARGMTGAQNWDSQSLRMLQSLHPAGFVTLWYVIGILGAVALVLVIVKYLRELFK